MKKRRSSCFGQWLGGRSSSSCSARHTPCLPISRDCEGNPGPSPSFSLGPRSQPLTPPLVHKIVTVPPDGFFLFFGFFFWLKGCVVNSFYTYSHFSGSHKWCQGSVCVWSFPSMALRDEALRLETQSSQHEGAVPSCLLPPPAAGKTTSHDAFAALIFCL